jgi:muconolactone D-isomerase
MLFQVKSTLIVPPGFGDDKLAELMAKEREHSKQLQLQGKLVHLWRVSGTRSSILIFKADTPEEFHDLFSSLPFFPYMTAEITALSHHPNAIATD